MSTGEANDDTKQNTKTKGSYLPLDWRMVNKTAPSTVIEMAFCSGSLKEIGLDSESAV